MEDNFPPGLVGEHDSPRRGPPHYTQSDCSPLEPPAGSLLDAGQSSAAALIVMLLTSCGTPSSFLSSLRCLSFLNHAALGKSKGTVRILLLISFPRRRRRSLHDAACDPAELCRFLSVLNRPCGQGRSVCLCVFTQGAYVSFVAPEELVSPVRRRQSSLVWSQPDRRFVMTLVPQLVSK